MPFVKLDAGFGDHPKVVGLSAEAFRAYVLSLCYAQAHLTDGAVPHPLAARWGGRRITAELTTAGLWEDEAGSLQIHDYLDHNRSRAEVERIREIRQANGKQGGRPRENQSGTEPESNLLSALDPVRFHSAKPRSTEVQLTEDSEPAAATAAAAAAAGRGDELADGGTLPPLLRHWERATGTTVVPSLADWLDSELGQGTPPEWLRDAISETGANGSKAWKYTRAIIERWRLQGRDTEGERHGRRSHGRPGAERGGEAPCRASGQYHDWPHLDGWCPACTEQEPITIESLRRNGRLVE